MTVRQSWNDDRIDGLEFKVDEGFRHVDRRFEQVDQRFEQVDKRFEQIAKWLERIDRRFEQIDRRFEGFDVAMDNLRRMMMTFCLGIAGCFATLFTTLLVVVLTQL